MVCIGTHMDSFGHLVTTSALLMGAISDGLSEIFGITTPYAQQKNNNLKQKTAIKKARAKSQRLAAKMVTRNVMDAGSVFIPVGGAVVGVGFAAADVYAACELIDIQNELSETLLIPNDTSVGNELCLDAVAFVESLPDLPDVKAPQWERELIKIFNAPSPPIHPQVCELKDEC